MIEDGLLSELQGLIGSGELNEDSLAAEAIGYKELIAYLNGKTELEDAVEEIKLSTRRYAKRQLTWFRHMERESVYLDFESGKLRPFSDIKSEVFDLVEKFLIKEEKE